MLGCRVFAKHIMPGINKLADQSMSGVFLGYESRTEGYRAYDPINNKLNVTRDVIFDEKQGWNWGNIARSDIGVGGAVLHQIFQLNTLMRFVTTPALFPI